MNRCMSIAIHLGLFALLSSFNAPAAVSLSGTRLIFDGRFHEASLDVVNRGNHEVLIQAWLSEPDNVEGNPDTAGDLPFVLTPHLMRLDRSAKQVIRVLYQGQGMGQDVESLLHLYVLEIPRRADSANQLSIAIRQRINLFYRPAGLTEDPAKTALRLRWTLASGNAGLSVLRVSNPTPYHAALQDVRLDGVPASEYLLLAPGASHELPVAAVVDTSRLSFEALNDYGGVLAYCAHGNRDGFNNTEYRQKDC
jgi:P pilus assembly chaperone PapD